MSLLPPEITKTISVYHLPTASGKQPYPATASATIFGAFLPMDRQAHVMEGQDFVDPYEVYVEAGEDVRVGDKLVIDSTTYYVKKVFSAQFGGLPHKRLSISTQA